MTTQGIIQRANCVTVAKNEKHFRLAAAAVRPDGVPEVDHPEEGGPGNRISRRLGHLVKLTIFICTAQEDS